MLEINPVSKGRNPSKGFRLLRDLGGKATMSKFSPKKYPVLTTALALIVVYSLAYLYEKSLLRLIWYDRDNIDFLPWRANLVSSIAPLLIILVIFALAWIALRYLPPSWFSAALYLISGLITIGLTLSIYIILLLFGSEITLPGWLRSSSVIGQFRILLWNSGGYGCRSSIYYLASGCILIGIAVLWKVKKNKQDDTQEM